MRYLFHKSGLVIFFFAGVSFVLCSGFAAINQINQNSNKFLTNDAAFVVDDDSFLYSILGIIVMLVLINVFSVTVFWLSGKRMDIFARKLSGAEDKKILNQLLAHYLGLVFFAFCIGGIIAYIASQFALFPVQTQFSWLIFLIGLLCTLLLGGTVGVIIISYNLKKQLIKLRR